MCWFLSSLLSCPRAPLLLDGLAPGWSWWPLWLRPWRWFRRFPAVRGAEFPALGSSSAAEPERWIVWVSVDPRSGQLDVYPGEVARKLEAARSRGEASVSLGEAFLDATVHVQDPPVQRTARGRRDARRLALPRPRAAASLRVARGPRGWRAAEDADAGAGHAEERTAHVFPEMVVDLHAEAAAAAGGTVGAAGPSGEEELRRGDVPMRALWEWCRRDGQRAAAAHALQDSDWGVYSWEQNAEIEAAFQAGEPHAEVNVGIRNYRVVFGPEAGFARQVDCALFKRRLVRRRLVTAEEQARALEPAARPVARGQESCAICCVDFAESAAMPVIELPGCQHAFHMACAQQLADNHSPCPCCREPVDWARLPRTPHSRRRG